MTRPRRAEASTTSPAATIDETLSVMRPQRVVRLPGSGPSPRELELIDWLLREALEQWRRTA